MLLKYKCDLYTTIVILMAVQTFPSAAFLPPTLVFQEHSKKTQNQTKPKTKQPPNPSPSPKLALPWLSEHLALFVRISQNIMKNTVSPCLHCLNASPWITFRLQVSNSFINRVYFRLIMHRVMFLIEVLWVYKKIPRCGAVDSVIRAKGCTRPCWCL